MADELVAFQGFSIRVSTKREEPPTGDVLVASMPFTIQSQAPTPEPSPVPTPMPTPNGGEIPDWVIPAAIAGVGLILLLPKDKK